MACALEPFLPMPLPNLFRFPPGRRKEPGRNDFICMYTPLGFLGAARLPDMRWFSYDRDGEGRRTAKLVDNQKVEGYGWDRQGRLAWCFDVASGDTCWFEYGDKDARLPVSMQRSGHKYMLGWDHVGSLRAVIDGQGRVVKEIEYDAFGSILRESAPELKVPFGFAGGLHDRDTGLIRYRFRDYLPDVGRFTAKDPLGYKGGDSDLYGYCLDDPVNGIDPSGLKLLGVGANANLTLGGGAVGGGLMYALNPETGENDLILSGGYGVGSGTGLSGGPNVVYYPEGNDTDDFLGATAQMGGSAKRGAWYIPGAQYEYWPMSNGGAHNFGLTFGAPSTEGHAMIEYGVSVPRWMWDPFGWTKSKP